MVRCTGYTPTHRCRNAAMHGTDPPLCFFHFCKANRGKQSKKSEKSKKQEKPEKSKQQKPKEKQKPKNENADYVQSGIEDNLIVLRTLARDEEKKERPERKR